MMSNNPKPDLAKMNADITFGEILSIGSQDFEQKRNFDTNQGPLLRYKCGKMTCNNPKLDLVIMNAYIKFGEKMSISSQDIERKRNFGLN